MRHIRLSATFTAGVALAAAAVTPSSAGPPGPSHTTVAAGTSGSEATVHLITGDSVTVAKGPDDRQTASVRPGSGRDDIVFHTFEEHGHLTVLPSDASALVPQSRLDRVLFDATRTLAPRGVGAPSFGAPGGRHSRTHPSLSQADGKLLSLLVAGVADTAIASQTGLSRRTVQRRIQNLMERAGAGTRMQPGGRLPGAPGCEGPRVSIALPR
ncbi:helix-turn-helix transcriptional regulator [Streptomyces sp. NPDC057557]|uniref:helix-turn-helix transcriptional regulator n=1 Tax=Streptomyces sp. NPDC057557 TaxID=3346167 RepID=UPI0036A6D3EB